MSPVFNEAKYRALLEKLEVSEVNLNDLEFSWRIDAEYYQKHFLALQFYQHIKYRQDGQFRGKML